MVNVLIYIAPHLHPPPPRGEEKKEASADLSILEDRR
jgi:hypothetical protein